MVPRDIWCRMTYGAAWCAGVRRSVRMRQADADLLLTKSHCSPLFVLAIRILYCNVGTRVLIQRIHRAQTLPTPSSPIQETSSSSERVLERLATTARMPRVLLYCCCFASRICSRTLMGYSDSPTHHQCSLGTAACYLLFMLTCAHPDDVIAF